jgi:hypothetical protein
MILWASAILCVGVVGFVVSRPKCSLSKQKIIFERQNHKSPYSLENSLIFLVEGLHIATEQSPSWCGSIWVWSDVISKMCDEVISWKNTSVSHMLTTRLNNACHDVLTLYVMNRLHKKSSFPCQRSCLVGIVIVRINGQLQSLTNEQTTAPRWSRLLPIQSHPLQLIR